MGNLNSASLTSGEARLFAMALENSLSIVRYSRSFRFTEEDGHPVKVIALTREATNTNPDHFFLTSNPSGLGYLQGFGSPGFIKHFVFFSKNNNLPEANFSFSSALLQQYYFYSYLAA